MKKIKIVERDGVNVPEESFPSDAISIRGDIEPGFYLCYQPGDTLPPPAVTDEG